MYCTKCKNKKVEKSEIKLTRCTLMIYIEMYVLACQIKLSIICICNIMIFLMTK